MKRFLALLLILFSGVEANALCAPVPFTFIPNTVIASAQVNANFQSLENCANGIITGSLPMFNVLSTQFGPNTGTGGDDSSALNAVSAACQVAGGCGIMFPPGAQLNVCASPWVLPHVAPISVVVYGSGRSFGGVRTLRTCATPPVTVIDSPAVTYGSPDSPYSANYTFYSLA